MDIDKNIEMRLTMLEECCTEYKVRVSELEEQLRRTNEEMERKLHTLNCEEIVGNPEFEIDADRLAFQLKAYISMVDKYKLDYLHMLDVPVTSALHVDSVAGPFFEQGVPYKKSCLEVMFELYEKTIHVSRLYKLAGNLLLSDKYRKDAEKVYYELKLIEDKVENLWRREQDKYAELDARLGGNASKKFAGPIWNRVTKGRQTLPTPIRLEGGIYDVTSLGGSRKNRQRKNNSRKRTKK